MRAGAIADRIRERAQRRIRAGRADLAAELLAAIPDRLRGRAVSPRLSSTIALLRIELHGLTMLAWAMADREAVIRREHSAMSAALRFAESEIGRAVEKSEAFAARTAPPTPTTQEPR